MKFPIRSLRFKPHIFLMFLLGITSVGHSATVTWTGIGSATWNLSQNNWTGGSPSNTKYVVGDNVIFDDTGISVNPTIAIQTAANPVGAMTVSNTTGTYSFGSLISATTLTKNGAGTLSFTGNNANQPVFSGGVTLNSGTILAQANFTSAINVAGNATLGSISTASPTYTGTITGASELTLTPYDSTRSVTFSGDVSGFTGTMKSSSAGNVNFTTGAFNLSNAGVNLSGNTSLQVGVVTGGIMQIGQITTGASNILARGANNGTLTFQIGNLNNASSIQGVITNNGVGISGATVSVNKVGSGTLTVSGDNTYTGATTVTAGTMLINGDQSLATGTVTVDATGTLGGSGTVGGATTINGTLSPGNSPGTLTFDNNLTLANGSTLLFEAGDLVAVNAQLTLATNWTLQLNSSANWQLGGTTTLFTYSTLAGSPALTPTFTDNTGLGGSLTLSDTGSAIVLNGYSVVPEPATLALVGFGMGLLIWRRRSSAASR